MINILIKLPLWFLLLNFIFVPVCFYGDENPNISEKDREQMKYIWNRVNKIDDKVELADYLFTTIKDKNIGLMVRGFATQFITERILPDHLRANMSKTFGSSFITGEDFVEYYSNVPRKTYLEWIQEDRIYIGSTSSSYADLEMWKNHGGEIHAGLEDFSMGEFPQMFTALTTHLDGQNLLDRVNVNYNEDAKSVKSIVFWYFDSAKRMRIIGLVPPNRVFYDKLREIPDYLEP